MAVTSGQDIEKPRLVPAPAEMEVQPGRFPLRAGTLVRFSPGAAEVRSVAEYLADQVEAATGVALQLAELDADEQQRNMLVIKLEPKSALGPEGYTLTVQRDGVSLVAGTAQGLFYGVQTLRQLLQAETPAALSDRPSAAGAWVLPCVRIADQPRYRWRGMLLDCGRHFMDKEFVKRCIDLLAFQKMNVLHWHLTEDQGWRLEIKKYPRLTEIGAWRTATRDSEQPRRDGLYGGFYSQADVREIVAYAQNRHVTIVPEIELPGHCLAALAAYPELSCTAGPFEVGTRWGVYEDVYCAGNDETFRFLEDVLTEVMELFPSPYIHIGGDEVPKTRWRACPKCRARIVAEGLKDEHELQSYFIRRIERFLNEHGRRIVGWDEILEGGLAPNATVQSWRGMAGAIAAATADHDVISSPTSHCYLDYPQGPEEPDYGWMGRTTLAQVYTFEPTPAGLTPEQAARVLGLEGNLWTEQAPQIRAEWQLFPRLCAIAEIGWTPAAGRTWSDFQRRMQGQYPRLDALGVNYYITPPVLVTPETAFEDAVEVLLDNPLGEGVVRYTLDGSAVGEQSQEYRGPFKLRASFVLRARTFLSPQRASNEAAYQFRHLVPQPPVHTLKSDPGLAVAYYPGKWRALPDFSTLKPEVIGTAEQIDLTERGRDTEFALRFAGFISAPRDGRYTFYALSDDGARLWVGDELIVDNDRLHVAREGSGPVLLQAGLHPFVVEYFQAGGALQLDVLWQPPGGQKEPIPPDVLFH